MLCAAFIVGVLQELAANTGFQKQLRLVCGIFMAVILVRPLLNLRLPDLSEWTGSFSAQAEQAAQLGENIRIASLATIIRRESEAYILKEAEALGAEVEAELELDAGDPPAPAAVTIRGAFDDTMESALGKLLAEELGIPKERQTWIRQPKPTSSDSWQSTNPSS